MSRGLGTVQRALLLAAGRIVIAEAEQRAARQQRFLVSSPLTLDAMLRHVCDHELRDDYARRKAEGDARYAARTAAHPELDAVADRLRPLLAAMRKSGPRRNSRKPDEVDRRLVDRWYNPSRALAMLEQRMLLSRVPHPLMRRFYRIPSSADGVRLTGAGLREAVRLGGLTSEVIDLNQFAADTIDAER
jgi:hypothetical protein